MKDLACLHDGSATLGERWRDGADPAGVAVDVTTELRWFHEGAIADDVVTWFTRGGTTGLIEERCDSYRTDGQPDIGVKRRFGTTLELKIRLARPELCFLGGDAGGRLEVWQRWSPADGKVYLAENTTWLGVDKTIIKRRFGPDGEEQVLTEATRPMTGEGCDAEIAALSAQGRHAWTVAFAAFGPLDGHRTSLELAWSSLTEGQPRPNQLRLHDDASMGYPEWLATTRHPGARTAVGSGRP